MLEGLSVNRCLGFRVLVSRPGDAERVMTKENMVICGVQYPKARSSQ